MRNDDERDDLEALIADWSATDPEFPVALAAAEERLAIMTRLEGGAEGGGAEPRSRSGSDGDLGVRGGPDGGRSAGRPYLHRGAVRSRSRSASAGCGEATSQGCLT